MFRDGQIFQPSSNSLYKNIFIYVKPQIQRSCKLLINIEIFFFALCDKKTRKDDDVTEPGFLPHSGQSLNRGAR